MRVFKDREGERPSKCFLNFEENDMVIINILEFKPEDVLDSKLNK